MTIEPYIKQYAKAKKKSILNNELMRKEFKQNGIKNIENAIKFRERGLITDDERIKMIADCMSD